MMEAFSFKFLLHSITFVVSLGLFVLSVKAYQKKKNRKFLYIVSAFGLYGFKEFLLLLNVWIGSGFVSTFCDVTNLAVLLLFYGGIRE